MLSNALERSFRAVPVKTLDELRPTRGRIALRCYLPNCTSCASFDGDGRVAFEESLEVSRIIPWNCSAPENRRLAKRYGIKDIPAYIIVPSRPGKISMRQVP